MPIRFFEGIPPDQLPEVTGRQMEVRFYALAAAVRDHEASARRTTPASKPRDERLYRRLRVICGESDPARHRVG
ncbi:MAG: hypothetical protein EDQ89_07410 [Acidobacteria bacterium]|nr:MAG: hypothetical protein EDQ89_07410 [Acidobacteriota bacterium]MCL4288262.1 hypothetical protein [Thermoleophilia bacterium]GIK76394.1 MAG: hypothetical protein BroJett022_00840 [Actinomycetes bacterium]